MVKISYKTIGRISLIYGIFGAINTLIGIVIGYDYELSDLFSSIILLILFAISSFILLSFKVFINDEFENNSLDGIIYTMIGINILSAIFEFLFLVFSIDINKLNFKDNMELLFFILLFGISCGVMNIIYSNKIKKVKNTAWFQVYANLQLVSGILTLTFIGIMIASFLEYIGFICLYFIFTEKKREVRKINVEKNILEQKVDKNIVFLSKTKKEMVEEYYQSILLNTEEYYILKNRALAYLPKNLSEEDVKVIIKQYIEREVIK